LKPSKRTTKFGHDPKIGIETLRHLVSLGLLSAVFGIFSGAPKLALKIA